MTTLAIGSSVTVAVRDGGTVAIATNGGLASAVVSLTEGVALKTPWRVKVALWVCANLLDPLETHPSGCHCRY